MFSKHKLIPEGSSAAASAIKACTFNYLSGYCTSKAEWRTQMLVNIQLSHIERETLSCYNRPPFRSCGSLPPHPESKALAVLCCHRVAIQQEVLAVISKATGKWFVVHHVWTAARAVLIAEGSVLDRTQRNITYIWGPSQWGHSSRKEQEFNLASPATIIFTLNRGSISCYRE